jgi:hypothetical protein
MNLSMADLRNYRTEFHETWWSYRYMFLVDPKVFRFVVKGVKAIFLGVQRLKMQNCSSNGDLSLCQILCNINVRNFNFPIGFYSNPHPL